MWSLHKLSALNRERPQERRQPHLPSAPPSSSRSTELPSPGAEISPTFEDRAGPLTAGSSKIPIPTWNFSIQELERFPALRRRNFWCVQRHQARGKMIVTSGVSEY